MGVLNDVGSTLKNVVLMQANLERMERSAERQDRDIAGLRDAVARLSERLVRVETIVEEARATARNRPALPKE